MAEALEPVLPGIASDDGAAFWQRYYTDGVVYNLANARAAAHRAERGADRAADPPAPGSARVSATDDTRPEASSFEEGPQGLTAADVAQLKEEAAASRLRRLAAVTPSVGAEMIAAERRRQIEVEGWTPDHDDEHYCGEMAGAATSYAHLAARQLGSGMFAAEMAAPPSQDWRWSHEWWKPSEDPLRNLVRAGALIAAEIDRLVREREA